MLLCSVALFLLRYILKTNCEGDLLRGFLFVILWKIDTHYLFEHIFGIFSAVSRVIYNGI